ncbi:MAG: hypothetical protein C4329_04680 [Chitinophagaceae bacterium]
MKQIQFIAFLMYNLFSVILVALLFLSVVVIAEKLSWYILLVYIPIMWLAYHVERTNYRRKKPVAIKKKI